MNIPFLLAMTLMLTAGTTTRGAPVATPIVPPYAVDRNLLPTDFIRLEWKDAARDRVVPAKMYFPADADGPFPIILFSHGLGGTREHYEYVGRQWAANGYVVVHLQHIGTDDSAWRRTTRPMESMRGAITVQAAIDRAKDVKFAIDQLQSLNQTGESKLKGKLDLKHIGMAGHSFGAHTTMAIAGQGPSSARANAGGAGGGAAGKSGGPLRDPRVSAAIAMSPNVPLMRNNLDAVFAGVKIPVFYMTGTNDNSPLGDTRADERRIPFDHTSNSPGAYLLILDGADHMTFSGRLAQDRKRQDDDFQKYIRLASTAFWDAYLKDDAAAKTWLEMGFPRLLASVGTFERK